MEKFLRLKYEPSSEPTYVGEKDTSGCYMGTSLIRNNPTLGPCSRPVPRALLWS